MYFIVLTKVKHVFIMCRCSVEGCTAGFNFPNKLKRHMKKHEMGKYQLKLFSDIICCIFYLTNKYLILQSYE